MKSIPGRIVWLNEDACASISAKPDTLEIEAAPATNLFVAPNGDPPEMNAPMALFKPAEKFLFSVRTTADLASTFDAGALIAHCGDTVWAKLAYEYSPQGKPMLVSVVTNQRSDDVNHLEVETSGIYLRIAGFGDNVYAFHYSEDGHLWHMARYFRLQADEPARIGFSAQSPTGSGLNSRFTDILYEPQVLEDLRSGI